MSQDNPSNNNPLFAAWREQLERARANPFLFQLLLKQFQRILKRLAYFYAQLASLPRRNRRALQRALATSLIGAAMLLALSSAPVVHAATITVDPGASGFNPGDGCSLAEAIVNANYDNQSGSTECVAGSGADTIELPSSATLDYMTYFGPPISALPIVYSEITIEGNDSTISRNVGAADYFSLFAVVDTGDLTLNDLTLTGGKFPTPFIMGGGAVINYDGDLTLNHCTITGNLSFVAGGVGTFLGETEINDSTISKNLAYLGGGVVNYYATTIINNSTISNNSAFTVGGGVINYLGETTLNRTTVSGNTARGGGGIAHYYQYDTEPRPPSNLILRNSTVSNNDAAYDGGGILNGEFSLTLLTTAQQGDNAAPPRDGFGKLKELRRANGGKLKLSQMSGQANIDPSLLDKLSNPKLERSRVSGDAKSRPQHRSAQRTAPRKERKRAPRQVNSPFSPADASYYVTTYIYQSTIDNNTANDNGGGISNRYGGGLAMVNSTISGNTATYGGGGGIDALYGYVGLLNVTITDNHADYAGSGYGGGIENDFATVGMARTLISGNTAYAGNEIAVYQGATTSYGFNLFGHDGEDTTQAFVNFLPGASDFLSTSDGSYATPLAGILDTTLALNSNPFGTLTNALVTGSPAIDKAPNADCAAFPVDDIDQRGAPRNFDFGPPSADDCDIGAFEYGAPTAVNVTRFTGRAAAEKNVLKWRTTTESQIAGFNVYRKVGKGKWKQLNAELKQAKTPGDAQGHRYVFRDKKVRDGRMYRYKIQVQYLDNHTEWTDVILVSTK